MHLIFLLPFTTLFVNLLLGVYVLANNTKEKLNRLYFLVTFSLIIWCAGDIFFFLAESPIRAMWGDKLGTIGSSLTTLFLIHFFLTFGKKKVHVKLLYWIFIAIPLFFISVELFTNLIGKTVQQSAWGYTLIPGPLYIPYTLSLILYVVIGIIICFRVYQRSTSEKEKTQAKLLILAESIPVVGGIITEMLPVILGYQIVQLTSTFSTITALVIGYAMVKHGLMTITPETAATNIIETMTDYLVVLNGEGKIALVNKSCVSALGFEKEELIGKDSTLLFPSTETNLLELIATNAPIHHLETKITIKEGSQIPVLVNGSRMNTLSSDHGAIVLVLQDMREMHTLVKSLEEKTNALEEAKMKLTTINVDLESKVKERTQELLELKNNLEKNVEERSKKVTFSEARFSQVAEAAGEWIWEVDCDGMYTYSSPVVERILGYTPEEIVGKKHFYDFFPGAAAEEMKNAALDIIRKKEKISNFPNENVHKNGTLVLLETNGAPICDETGNVIGFRGADTDITERDRAEKELRKRTEELEQMNSLMVGRELKMTELKKEIEELKKRLATQ